jgi:tetratricopeptide (TPR) repeat protein
MAEGARRAVLVSGEPGIGKTRLVTEAVRAAHDRGSIVLWGRCDEDLGAPYGPFAEALRHYVLVTPPDQVRAEVGALGGELVRIVPDIASRVPGLAEPMVADAETERFRLFDAVADLLSEISAAAPVVLVLDDLHWADKPSLVLLRHLLRSPTPMRVLFLGTYRDTDLDRSHPLSDVLGELRRQPGVDRLDLQGLDQDEIAGFMANIAGHELTEGGLDLAQTIHTETEGNPFFVREVLLHLAESGAIVQGDDGRWTTSGAVADFGIPEGVREVVGRRLSRLSDAVNRALAIAAVIGPTFDLSTIEGAGGPSGDELFDALDEATQFGLIREAPGAPGRYAFAHALVRASLYEELTTNRRVRMHWRIGEVIEARYASKLDEHLDELAFHFGEGALAGDAAKAADFSHRAGERALADLAFESAAAHFERGLGSMELLDDAPTAERCDLLLAWADALLLSGDDRKRQAVFDAAALARETGDIPRLARAALVLVVREGANQRIGNVDAELVALIEEALAALGPAPSPERAQLLSSLAVELQHGTDDARRTSLATEALAVARETGDPVALGHVLLRSWAMIDGSRPWHVEFASLNAEAAEFAQAIGNVDALQSTELFAMSMASMVGDRGEADRHLATYVQLGDRSRRRDVRVHVQWRQAQQAVFAGRLAEGERLTIEALAQAADAGIDPENVSASIGSLFYMIRQGQGRLDELIPALEDLVTAQPGLPTWRLALAGAFYECDRFEEARPHYDWLIADECAVLRRDVMYPVNICGLARMAIRLDAPRAVVEYLYGALLPFTGIFNWTGGTMGEGNDTGLAIAAEMLGRPDDADRHHADAIELCERAGARAYLARVHYFHGRLLDERGDVVGARPHVETAIEIGEEIGMTGPFGVVVRGGELLASLDAG